jgi:hypothetical protein
MYDFAAGWEKMTRPDAAMVVIPALDPLSDMFMVSKTVFQTGLLKPYQDPPCSREAQDPPNLLRHIRECRRV